MFRSAKLPNQTFLGYKLRAYTVFGANTNVGKTIFTTLLLNTFQANVSKSYKVFYVKPLSTGPKDEADVKHISWYSPKISSTCFFQFDDPVSPHLAAKTSRVTDKTIMINIRDYLRDVVTESPRATLFLETAGGVHSPTPSGTSQADLYRPLRWPVCLIGDYRLGGISSTISAFESLHIRGYDVELVCMFEDEYYENHLYLKKYFEEKGVKLLSVPKPPEKDAQDDENMKKYYSSHSMERGDLQSAFQHLIRRDNHRIQNLTGMSARAEKSIWYPFTQHRDVSPQSIVTIDSAYGDFFQAYMMPPSMDVEQMVETQQQKELQVDDAASKTLGNTEKLKVDETTAINPDTEERVQKEEEGKTEEGIKKKAAKTVKSNAEKKVAESNASHVLNLEKAILSPTFDGSASWWTQGLGHGNPELSLEAAYAAGRYGHVIFAGTVHEPALRLAETLLKNSGNSRLSKCFFSDNGSTGMEVATKMALTAASERYKWDERNVEIGVIGLKGSYHGDTIGAMDCSEPSTFNEKVHWYQGRGYWFDFPQVKCVKGKWIVEPPPGQEEDFGEKMEFNSLAEIFDLETRCQSPASQQYHKYIEHTLHRLVKEEGKTFGALVMEPVVLGAGGMLFVDPLFQNTLANTIRSSTVFNPSSTPIVQPQGSWTGLPIVFDEVFTGIYRLGRFTSSSFLQVEPDISVHAKLLTGGLVPLCTTLASASIFEAFLGNEKRDALLHGHSYTAHPVGCHVANTSLDRYLEMDKSNTWASPRRNWREDIVNEKEDVKEASENGENSEVGGKGKRGKSTGERDGQVWSLWSKNFVHRASMCKGVESVNALGSVLVINLKDDANAGYNSSAATGLQKSLMEGPPGRMKVHCRVLGNVLYLMASLTTTSITLGKVQRTLLDKLSTRWGFEDGEDLPEEFGWVAKKQRAVKGPESDKLSSSIDISKRDQDS
ncbi:hypothetical protein G7Y89_g1880 [Cudoniella acicularis]|uniref:Dethiobiotin synthase n=1 Tax=Cudoniella acicularis TaxID=354080 RepID=A0A8H4RUF8_9HELO|nr:hypothetical protein G7Y89_g1880 [Cudoniella acicularis]